MLWIGILVGLLILNVLVILHEFGHYLAAKLFGVTVFEFGVGFPPNIATIWTGKKLLNLERLPYGASVSLEKGKLVSVSAAQDNLSGKLYAEKIMAGKQTENQIAVSDKSEVVIGKVRSVSNNEIVISPMAWTLNLLPLGGFVKLLSDNSKRGKGNLSAKSYWVQIIILLAGVAMNAVVPFMILTINQWLPTDEFNVVVQDVVPISPAYEAGVLIDDKIISIDGRAINSIGDLSFVIGSRLGAATNWEVERMGTVVNLDITLPSSSKSLLVGTDITLEEAQAYNENLNTGDILAVGFAGIRTAQSEVTQPTPFNFLGSIQTGFQQGADLILNSYNSVRILIIDRPDTSQPIFIGPAGLGQITGEIISADINWANQISILLLLAAIISFSLAVINVLPFPPLDGGKILFVVLQILNRGKPVPTKIQNTVNLVGFVALMLFAVYVLFSDIAWITGG